MSGGVCWKLLGKCLLSDKRHAQEKDVPSYLALTSCCDSMAPGALAVILEPRSAPLKKSEPADGATWRTVSLICLLSKAKINVLEGCTSCSQRHPEQFPCRSESGWHDVQVCSQQRGQYVRGGRGAGGVPQPWAWENRLWLRAVAPSRPGRVQCGCRLVGWGDSGAF